MESNTENIVYTSKLDKKGFSKLKKWKEKEYQELRSSIELVLKSQRINRKDIQLGFIGLATQNHELLELNKKLNKQLEKVDKELSMLKKEREERVAKKKARATRKRLPKRQPITREVYALLMQATISPRYTSVRLRIAFCLLTVTGVRINELLPLKVHQLKTLLESHWIGIDRSKRGPANHKAFLTREGIKLVEERKKDFKLLFLMKDLDSFVFTSESNHSKMLSRETITRDINRVLHSVSNSLTDKSNLTSHSFRVGYITQLWKDTADLEFVKQSIGHQRVDTTSQYIEMLSDQERQKRTLQLK